MVDLSAVGAAASAPKNKTGLAGDEVFTGEIRVCKADNGGAIVYAGMRRVQKTGKDQVFNSYCDDRKFAFTDTKAALAKVAQLLAMPSDSSLPDESEPDSGDGGEADEGGESY